MPRSWIRSGLLAAALLAACCVRARRAGATRAYVANRGAASLTVVDVETGAVLKTIPLEAPPHDVVVGRGRACSCRMPTANRLAVIDPAIAVGRSARSPVPGAPRDLDRRNQTRARLAALHQHRRRPAGLRWAANVLSPADRRRARAGSGRWKPVTPIRTGAGFVAACDGGATVRIRHRVERQRCRRPWPPATRLRASSARRRRSMSPTPPTTRSRVFTPSLHEPGDRCRRRPADWLCRDDRRHLGRVRQRHADAARSHYARRSSPRAHWRHRRPRFSAPPWLPAGTGAALAADAAGSLRVLSATGDLLRTAPPAPQPGAVDIGTREPRRSGRALDQRGLVEHSAPPSRRR